MEMELFKAALKRTQATWQRYITAFCILQIGFMIDALNGPSSFMRGNQPIDLAGFKVVREAISATYGILFFGFIVTAFMQSALLKSMTDEKPVAPEPAAVLQELPDPKLWIVSPFSNQRLFGLPLGLILVWGLFVWGFGALATFIVFHFHPEFLPTPPRVSTALFRFIGWLDLVIFLVCVPLGVGLFRNLEAVRKAIFTTAQPTSSASKA